MKKSKENNSFRHSKCERARGIIIGSRGSDLALWQANFILGELKKLHLNAEIKIIKTQGDKIQNLSFDKLEGKGFFTKEIEEALLKKEIDLAVHSHKDLPTDAVQGLTIAAVSERENPQELLLINKGSVDETRKFSLKENAIVGTSSSRRKSQLLAWRNDVQLADLRGNVPTRIQKLREQKYDAILLANAGVSRLQIDLSEFHCEQLSEKEFIPAPAQGVLALQIREEDKELFELLQPLNNKEAQETISIERKVLNLFDGGCQLPLGVHCEKGEGEDGKDVFKVRISKAEAWNKTPKHFYFESKNPVGFAERMVEKINASSSGKVQSVFITRDEKKNDFFKRSLEANNYLVSSRTLIEIRPVPMKRYKKCDWIFFPSKNAVKYFFEQTPDVEGIKFGTVGMPTAEELRKFGKRAEFIGTANDTRLTGKKFAALVGNKTVLFPQSKSSLKTIQKQMPRQENVMDVIVYETIKSEINFDKPLNDFDVLVFTSPSNVDVFFETHKITSAQKVVAMGHATVNALRKFGINTNKQPASFDDIGLTQAVFGV